MLIEKLCLTNYRNIENAEILFSPGINMICGENAQGKTNILESVYIFSAGKSYRTGKESDLIKFGCDRMTAELDYISGKRAQNTVIRLFSEPRRREIRINGVSVARTAELVGRFASVIFAPEHLDLVKSGPTERRRFLDFAISQLRPRYFMAVMEYVKILRQKNRLLKDLWKTPALAETLPVWNEKLCESGGYIVSERAAYIKRLEEKAEKNHADISGDIERLSLSYRPSGFEDGDFEKILENHEAIKAVLIDRTDMLRSAEIGAGTSLIGPHRDELEININGKSARIFGSQGQQRSAVLSMKIAECDIVREELGEYPVLLLDDILSELDQSRQEYILERITGGQVILTTCDMSAVLNGNPGAVFMVSGGEVSRG